MQAINVHRFIFSRKEIIEALKAKHPTAMTLQAIPLDNHKGVSMKADGIDNVEIIWEQVK